MRSARLLAPLVALLPLVSCGYGLVGRGGGFDPSIRKNGVPLFRDASGRSSLDQKITQKVVEELLKRGKIDVVATTEGVDAGGGGEIVS